MEFYDVAVVGAGPAGLAAALNLVRAHARVILIDSNRPRHAATLKAHGFITRDGIAPATLRSLGREEFLNYPNSSYLRAEVLKLENLHTALAADTKSSSEEIPAVLLADPHSQKLSVKTATGTTTVFARRVVLATGLREELPALPDIRSYYGTYLHSCVVCDGYEKTGETLCLIVHPETTAQDFETAFTLLRRFAPNILAFAAVSKAVALPELPIATELLGSYAKLAGIKLADGSRVNVSAGFVFPKYVRDTKLLQQADPTQKSESAIADPHTNIGVAGVFGAGEFLTQKPQQLLVAAGSGAEIVPEILLSLGLNTQLVIT